MLPRETLLTHYDDAEALLQLRLSASGYPETLLDEQKLLFQEMEQKISESATDTRHDIIVAIPVADRPQHLNSCLDSLLTLCKRFQYGGYKNNQYQKIKVLVADDSQSKINRDKIKNSAENYKAQGLSAIYFGPEEQLKLVDNLTPADRKAISSIIGSHPANAFYHKGASITRNLCYLKLKKLLDENPNTLVWFIDSDQEFRVNYAPHSEPVYSINYFHHIDRIFSNTETQILTGKVVGDPPVSPAVMGANFLQDMGSFLSAASRLDPEKPCAFHPRDSQAVEDAAYHDMAELFGFKPQHNHYDYRCTIAGEHNNKTCVAEFAAKLNAFFDGQHPTRQTCYKYQPLDASISDARTVYTGNYVFNAQGLRYFIPFATLGLRMAGPVLGRLLKTELGSKFISANLPLIHKRTLTDSRESEFRSGVKKHNNNIDLGGEFDRQFFGDVMLFTIQDLVQQGYPDNQLSDRVIENSVAQIAARLREKYSSKQNLIRAKIEKLRSQINHTGNWWQNQVNYTHTLDNLDTFLTNMTNNFIDNDTIHRSINNNPHHQAKCRQIAQAIIQYPQDRKHWLNILNTISL